MDPIRRFDPSRFTPPTAHAPVSDAHAPPPVRPTGSDAASSHPHEIPSRINREGRPPIKVGSFRLPRGVSKNRVAAWLKPLGQVTEVDADDSEGAQGDGGRRYTYRAQELTEGGDKPDGYVDVEIHVDNNGQLKRLLASLPVSPELKGKNQDSVEVNFHPPQRLQQPLGGLEEKLRQRAVPTERDKAIKEKLAKNLEALKDIAEEHSQRMDKLMELVNQINY